MANGGNFVVVVVVVLTTVVCIAGAKATCPRVMLRSTRGTLVEAALLIGLEELRPLLDGLPAERNGGSIWSFADQVEP